MILFLISFIAGILTVLAPCVLPLLPVVIGGSLAGERDTRRAFRIALSLGVSVFLFTFVLKVSTAFISVPPVAWQWISGGILVLFGLVMLVPALWDRLPFVNAFSRASNRALASGYQRHSRLGDIVMGASLGPVFSSCSPTYFIILATVLPANYLVGTLDLLAYCVGLSGFLLVISILGQRFVDRLGVAINPEGWFRRGIGILFILVGICIGTGLMAQFESWLLAKGFDATRLEQYLLGAPTTSGASATSSALLSPETKRMVYHEAPELVTPDGYINTGGEPITLRQFRGKSVVLLDIWTYSCINCQRTLPYLKAWYEKYHDQGLEIIGIHTPEFAFEKVQKNVEDAVARFGITYPVILDNEYQTWRALGNSYWPRKYLVDIDGYIVYDHIGEGNYEETEAAIRRALAERSERLGLAKPSAVELAPVGVIAFDGNKVQSPETYFGAARNEYLGVGVRRRAGTQTLTIPESLEPNTLYINGTWNFTDEYATNISRDARIVYYYSAKNVYFVGSSDKPLQIRVTRDGGKPLGSARGTDVDADGTAIIAGDRLYQLIGDDTYGAHTIEIEILSPGLKAYTFTFG